MYTNWNIFARYIKKKFKYLEIDIRITKDDKFVIYHGGINNGEIFSNYSTIKPSKTNKLLIKNLNFSWKTVCIKDLSYKQLRLFTLYGKGKQHILLLETFLYVMAELDLKKPIVLDLKDDNIPFKLYKRLIHMILSILPKNPKHSISFNKQKFSFLVYNKNKLSDKPNKFIALCKKHNIRIYTMEEHKIL